MSEHRARTIPSGRPEVGDEAARLLAAVAAGDQAALGELYTRTSSRLFGVALRLLRRHDLAEEALHDAYLKVWRRAGSYSPERGPALAWLTTITRRAALDRLRRQRREISLEDAPEVQELEAPGDEPLARIAASADGAALLGCLEKLGSEQRNCILLAYRDGYSHDELARLLGRPLGTVKSWVRRSLIRLKQCLER
ncbi:MAG TPA: sigma-70 family RNA polymerase sigma factor [Geminicoccaceae bacterium]